MTSRRRFLRGAATATGIAAFLPIAAPAIAVPHDGQGVQLLDERDEKWPFGRRKYNAHTIHLSAPGGFPTGVFLKHEPDKLLVIPKMGVGEPDWRDMMQTAIENADELGFERIHRMSVYHIQIDTPSEDRHYYCITYRGLTSKDLLLMAPFDMLQG